MEQCPRIYLKMHPKVLRKPGEKILLYHVADFVTDCDRTEEIRNLLVYIPRPEDGNRVVIDLMQVVRLLKKVDPFFDIQNMGPEQTLVHLSEVKKSPNLLLVIFVWFTLFIGSGLAIMNFHVDVSMLEVHQRVYELITGERVQHPYIIQIPYSIGIGLGMLLFFNHLFRKRFNEEPSPLEVEVFLYQQNVDQYTIIEQRGQGEKK